MSVLIEMWRWSTGGKTMAGENTSAPTKTQVLRQKHNPVPLFLPKITHRHPSFESRPMQCLAETDRLSNGMALIQPPNSRLTLRRHTYWSKDCIVLSTDEDSPYWESTLAPNPLLLLHPTSHELKYYTHTYNLNSLQNTIKWFIPSEHYNIYNQQHHSMATSFGPFLDHPQANI
jgi:hypothetical protein